VMPGVDDVRLALQFEERRFGRDRVPNWLVLKPSGFARQRSTSTGGSKKTVALA